MNLALKRQDSFIIADAHWNYAVYYNRNEIYDKSYYHYNIGYKFFKIIKKIGGIKLFIKVLIISKIIL